MREHQIVITLKPEQFLEVQRLSRAAGAKSMGMFVRQKLLAALGLEGAPLVAAQPTVSPNVRRLTSELNRLHSQLKEFVAESLAPTYVTELPAPVYTMVPEEAEIPSPGQGLPVGYDLDEYAESSFGDDEDPYDVEEPPAPPAAPAESRIFMESEDKLEQFARRAFAISPRLGAIELPGDRAPEAPVEDQWDPSVGATGNAPANAGEQPRRPAVEQSRRPAVEQPRLPLPEVETPPTNRSGSRDPLEDLLEDASAVETAAQPPVPEPKTESRSEFEEFGEDEDDEEDEDVDVDVTLSMSNLTKRVPTEQKSEEQPPAPDTPPQPPQPPPGPLDLSGGPPPKRR